MANAPLTPRPAPPGRQRPTPPGSWPGRTVVVVLAVVAVALGVAITPVRQSSAAELVATLTTGDGSVSGAVTGSTGPTADRPDPAGHPPSAPPPADAATPTPASPSAPAIGDATTTGGGVAPSDAYRFLDCVRARESAGDYRAVNPSGAAGAYQLMPATARAVALRAGRTDLAATPANLWSPADQDVMAALLYEWQGAAPWGGACWRP